MTSAFPKGTGYLASLVRKVKLDIPALSKPLLPCELSVCHGTCCHDGVYLTGEEAQVLRDLADTESSDLEKLGTELPPQVVVYGRFHHIASGPKTAVRAAPMSEKVADYPLHFQNTQCVFLLQDARCALQALAMERGLDPWFYKPFTCWIHPLSFTKDAEGEDILTLYDKNTDPHKFDDYDGFTSQTHCGRQCDTGSGQPAYEVLESELDRLGQIGGRDLLAEIRNA
ncbi:MAG: DUF3109 family protein [Verrucomicrobiales bacterium]|nr:DUF3109 family protein [Verrucomicrobiales bacterium]